MQFNARSETVQEKSVFSRLLSSQRCIFMCEGFYEWKKAGVCPATCGTGCAGSAVALTHGLQAEHQSIVFHVQDGSKKQPYYISFGEESVMHMAGLYDVWHTGEENEVLGTFTILTTDSSKRLQWCAPLAPMLSCSRPMRQRGCLFLASCTAGGV
jgi:putative SOS response-associated peptidase YedK